MRNGGTVDFHIVILFLVFLCDSRHSRLDVCPMRYGSDRTTIDIVLSRCEGLTGFDLDHCLSELFVLARGTRTRLFLVQDLLLDVLIGIVDDTTQSCSFGTTDFTDRSCRFLDRTSRRLNCLLRRTKGSSGRLCSCDSLSRYGILIISSSRRSASVCLGFHQHPSQVGKVYKHWKTC